MGIFYKCDVCGKVLVACNEKGSHMMHENTFGETIVSARKKLGFTQKQLAEKILREDGESISSQYLNDIEHNRRSPSSDHIIKEFARVLKLEADYLHYLNGRFPENERRKKLNQKQFIDAIMAFRKSKKKVGNG